MSPLLAPALIALLLLIGAVSGPPLIRAAAPALMRAPRLAVTLLMTGLGTWLLAAAALSLVLAWSFSGPRVLPGGYGELCQRCLAAASPFAPGHAIETTLPVIVLVLVPVLAAALLLAVTAHRMILARRTSRSASEAITRGGRREHLAGHEVWVIPDDRPLAFALPPRVGGIVLSDGLHHRLTPRELDAVLAHETAHLRQRHHLIMAALRAVAEPLRWIPLAAAILEAVPHYLEIAADTCASDHVGTPVLAGALLKIGAPVGPDSPGSGAGMPSPLLHAGGPDRIRQLVAPARADTALLPMTALLLLVAALTVVGLAAHTPYLQVALAGCTIPV